MVEPCQPAPEVTPEQGGLRTKPIPRWDVHFGEIDDDRKDSRHLISPLGPNWVGTDSAV